MFEWKKKCIKKKERTGWTRNTALIFQTPKDKIIF